MDRGRNGHHQGWDNNSAQEEGHGAVHDPNFRVSGSYDARRFIDDRLSRQKIYPRNVLHHDLEDRETYALPPSDVGLSPQTMRGSYEEDCSHERYSRRKEKSHGGSYQDMSTYNEPDKYCDIDTYQELDKFRDRSYSSENYRDNGDDKSSRFRREYGGYAYDDYDNRGRVPYQKREDSRERYYDRGMSYDSDYDRGTKRDSNWRRHESRDRQCENKGLSRDRDRSPYRSQERSHSRGYDDRRRSRSPRGHSHSRRHREDSYDADQHLRSDKRRDHDERYRHEYYSVGPSATVVVKGLSEKTTDDDIYKILADWGPLRHVRVIREQNSGISRGFAFIDFPSVDAARAMMDRFGDEGLVLDDGKLFFEYSSKPTEGMGEAFRPENATRSSHLSRRSIKVPSDWLCSICGCMNFARRISCFQCNERRIEDAPPADMSLPNSTQYSRKGFEAGPTHVLVVRGLDENADEEVLRYEFSKHAPIKDLRLVRDRYTHVSRGFGYVHFYSIEDATKTLEAINGTILDKNGQVLRVAYAKGSVGPLSGTSGVSQSNSLAAAAIEAATFSQQYDSVGWAPKEYNPDEKQSTVGKEQNGGDLAAQRDGSAPHSGFVWDEASGYYFDATSGFYYDGNTGLYYDGNNAIWYSYDDQTQQYIPCTDQNNTTTAAKESEPSSKASDNSNNRKVVISAPAATITLKEKADASLPDAVEAAAAAAMAAEKKGKEKLKEIKLTSKSSLLANKKKMNNVLTKWKQRGQEGKAIRVTLDENQPLATADTDIPNSTDLFAKRKFKNEFMINRESSRDNTESTVKPKPLTGVIRGSVKLDSSYLGKTVPGSLSSAATITPVSLSATAVDPPSMTPFRTDASSLGAYPSQVNPRSGKRRFSETPVQSGSSLKQQAQSSYRDRAAERRSLYGSSSSSIDDNLSELGKGDSNQESALRRGYSDHSMPFPPGVGGGPGNGNGTINTQSYEVITAEKTIDESNVGNRMLRSMGWHEGSGLGRDGSGMIEPVKAHAMDTRAGLGSRQKMKLDPDLEVQAGDSYRTLIQKKSLARFMEMS